MLQVDVVCAGQVDTSVVACVSDGLAREIGAQVALLEDSPVPPEAYNGERDQFSSTDILKRLYPKGSPKGRVVLVVTSADLYVPQLNFVFGEARPDAGTCIISLARLGHSYEGKSVGKRLLTERALKEAVHEIGHVLGLGHCDRRDCVMFFSNSILDTDRKGHEFCNNCRHKILPDRK